jgi:hypothetical protein
MHLHLEGEHQVIFDEMDGIAEVDGQQKASMLMAWFSYNLTHVDGHQLTYVDFPSAFRWYQQPRTWAKRKRTTHTPPIGRVYWVSPRSGEKYFLRFLLHHVPGA